MSLTIILLVGWLFSQEAQVAVIVMLTKFLERRKIKAHCYWPCDFGEQELFGDISVQLISMHSEDDGNIVMRSFRLRHNVTGETRTTMHVHYTEWYNSHSSLPSPPLSLKAALLSLSTLHNHYDCSLR